MGQPVQAEPMGRAVSSTCRAVDRGFPRWQIIAIYRRELSCTHNRTYGSDPFIRTLFLGVL
jgi:hypothetical protein